MPKSTKSNRPSKGRTVSYLLESGSIKDIRRAKELNNELLSKTPQDYGYQEAGWQINLLKHWFARQGVDACDNTIVKALNRLCYVYKRFSKTLPKNAPAVEEKKARIKEIVEAIGQYKPSDIEILFVNETHFSNQPYVSRGWFKMGEKK